MASNLAVSVRADTAEARAQLALVQSDIRSLGNALRRAASDARDSDISGGISENLRNLGAQFEAARAEAARLNAELKEGSVSAFERLNEQVAQITGPIATLSSRLRETAKLAGVFYGFEKIRDVVRDFFELEERVTNLQRTLGLEREEALQTDVALRLIGQSSDVYAQVILRLEQHLRTNEARFRELGVATRDANGEFVKGPALLQNAIAAMQQFKAGTDQNLVSLELFGRGAREMYGFLDLTAPIMERAKQLIHDYGIELQNHQQMVEYKAQLATLGIAADEVGEKFAEQLVPAMAGFAAWLNGPGAVAVRGFATILKGLATAVIDVAALWQQLKVTAQTTWDQLTEILSSAMQKGKAILTGAWGDLERLSKEHEARMTAIAAAGEEERIQITLGEARSLEKIWGAEGGGAADVTLPDITVKGGSRSYEPPERGGRHARGGGGAEKGQADELETWREQLQAQLVAEQNFYRDSTAEELAFWRQKVALTASGSKQRAQVENTIYELRKRLAQEALHDDERAESQQEGLDRLYLTNFERNMQLMVARKQITTQQMYGFDIQYTRQLEAEEVKRLQAFINDDRLSEAEKQAYYQRLLALESDYDSKIVEFQTKAADQAGNAWKDAVKQLSDAFANAFSSVIDGTETVSQVFDDLVKSLVKDTLTSSFTSLFSSLLGGGGSGSGGGGSGLDLSNLLFGSGGLGSTLGLGQGGLLRALGIGGSAGGGLLGLLFGAGAATDQDFSGGVAGAAVSSTAGGGGGLLGWLFGGLGSLFAFARGGIVPSAQGGWAVPQLGPGGVLAQLHSNEMVLPENLSQGIQSAIAGGGFGGTPPVNFNVTAMDSQSVATFFKNNGAVLVAAINTAMRNGSALRGAT